MFQQLIKKPVLKILPVLLAVFFLGAEGAFFCRMQNGLSCLGATCESHAGNPCCCETRSAGEKHTCNFQKQEQNAYLENSSKMDFPKSFVVLPLTALSSTFAQRGVMKNRPHLPGFSSPPLYILKQAFLC